jgi:hypothetical protein
MLAVPLHAAALAGTRAQAACTCTCTPIRLLGVADIKTPISYIKALSHYKSTFTHEDIARFVNTHTVDVEQFEKVYQKIKNSEELIKLGKDDRDRDRYTTK